MLKKIYYITLLYLMLLAQGAQSQQPDPYEILDRIAQRLEKIDDYRVDLRLELDVDFINMPAKHAVMYYKKPSKVWVESDEFLLLPKRGFDFSIRDLLNEDYSAVYAGREDLQGRSHYLIKVIPTGRRSELVLANLWISVEGNQLFKMENFTRKKGSYAVDFEYDAGFLDLPSRMTISFEIEEFKFPVKFMGKSMEVDKEKLKEEGPKTGSVIFIFSNYELNGSID
jgi:hypothetical protein